MTLRYLFPLACIVATATAQEQSLDEQIAAAEAPIAQFRDNYRKALVRERDKAQAAGELEQVKFLENDLKAFEGGAWPDGSSIFQQREADFIIHFWRLEPKVGAELRKIAAKAQSPEVNKRIEERLVHWKKEPPGPINHGDRLLAYHWKLSRDPIAAGILVSFEPNATVKDRLKSLGIGFPEGASASLPSGTNHLIVKLRVDSLVALDRWLRSKNLL